MAPRRGPKSAPKRGPKGAPRRGPRKPRRNRRRPNRLLPRRPAKALSPYTAFVKEYFQKNKCKNAKEGIRDAAKAWKRMSDDERRSYAKKACDKSKAKYQGEMKVWKRQRDAIKLPPSAFALFLKDMWAKEDQNGQSVVEVGRRMAQVWKKMPADQKNAYKTEQNELSNVYFTVTGLLRSGEMSIEHAEHAKNVAIAATPALEHLLQGQDRAQDQAEEMDEEAEEEIEQ